MRIYVTHIVVLDSDTPMVFRGVAGGGYESIQPVATTNADTNIKGNLIFLRSQPPVAHKYRTHKSRCLRPTNGGSALRLCPEHNGEST